MFSEDRIIDNQWEARNIIINACGRKAKKENNCVLPQTYFLHSL